MTTEDTVYPCWFGLILNSCIHRHCGGKGILVNFHGFILSSSEHVGVAGGKAYASWRGSCKRFKVENQESLLLII